MDRREALRRTAAVTGLSISSSIGLGFLKGCIPSGKPTWPPIFLRQDEIKLVTAIADTILPTTDTPGALDVHVPEFIDLMLRDNISDEEKMAFREGLEAFTKIIDQEYSDSFEDCSTEQKMSILKAVDDNSENQFSRTIKNSFYRKVKQLTILGYYSSEYVMNNMLNYQPIPGRYEGCIALDRDNRIYVNNNV